MRRLQRVGLRFLFVAFMAGALVVVPAPVAHAAKYWKNTAGSGKLERQQQLERRFGGRRRQWRRADSR